jgi:hypothetical protein
MGGSQEETQGFQSHKHLHEGHSSVNDDPCCKRP